MTISRRVVIAGVATLPAAPTLASLGVTPELPDHAVTRDLADRLARIEQSAKELRELLQHIPEIEAAVPIQEDSTSVAARNAHELERISGELSQDAYALRDAALMLIVPHLMKAQQEFVDLAAKRFARRLRKKYTLDGAETALRFGQPVD